MAQDRNVGRSICCSSSMTSRLYLTKPGTPGRSGTSVRPHPCWTR